MSFLNKLREPHSKIFIHTVTPPPINEEQDESERKIAHIEGLMRAVSLDAVNIPEIQLEERNPRVTQFQPKLDPLQWAHVISSSDRAYPELILDKIVVSKSWPEQKSWFDEALEQFRNVLLVGGESSDIDYPGPQVHESANLITDSHHNRESYSLGGITIPTRRHLDEENKSRDEPQKLMRKVSAGIEYFISQVIYESNSTQELLRASAKLLDRTLTRPPRIILSFAPMSVERDLEFLRWWDVRVPKETESFIFSKSTGILDRSIEKCGQILREIIHFVRVENISIPIGVNIEHVSTRNLNGAQELASHLFKIYDEVG